MNDRLFRLGVATATACAIAAIVCRIAVAAPIRTLETLYTQTTDGNLASYRIDTNGSLRRISIRKMFWGKDPGSAVNPYGIDLSVPPARPFAYLQDPSGRASNLLCYRIAQDSGALQPSGACDSGQPIGKAAIAGGRLFGLDVDGNLRSYAINPSTGRLTPSGSPVPGDFGHDLPTFAAFGKFAYVVCNCGTVRSLRLAPRRKGSRWISIGQVPTGDQPDAIAIDPAHQFAYVANSGEGTISEYYIDPRSGVLKLNPIAQSIALHSLPASITIDPTGRFLYALGYSERAWELWRRRYDVNDDEIIDQFEIEKDGVLKSLGMPIRLLAGRSAVSRGGVMLADPSGSFVYVTAAIQAKDKSIPRRVVRGFRITSGGHLRALKWPPTPIFYDTGLAVSWLGRQPIAAAVTRDVTPLLALKPPHTGSFTRAGVLTTAPVSFISPNLLPDGRVFFLERDPYGNYRGQIYDPARGAIKRLGIIIARNKGAWEVAVLQGGKYLLRFWSLRSAAVIFDPTTMIFTPRGRLDQPCYGRGWLLNDGRILFPNTARSGELVTRPCAGEIYDQATGKSTALPATLKNPMEIFAKLANGDLLLRMNPQAVSIFDPKTGTSEPGGKMPDRLMNLTSVTLKDGRVFIVGDVADGWTPYRTERAELYDPKARAFTEVRLPKRSGRNLALLRSGKVLLTGGYGGHAELFDPVTGHFSSAGWMNVFGISSDPLPLRDGTVLLTGSEFNGQGKVQQSIELYHPSA